MQKFIIELVKTAGAKILTHFNRDKIIKIKSKTQIVTQADLIADRYIIKAIKKNYPGHQIITEESGTLGEKSTYTWIVDPLDGTTNYSFGSLIFAVSIGLAKNGKIIMGAIYAPHLKELYFSELNQGAYLNNKAIKVSKVESLDHSIITYCHGSTQADIKRALKIYNAIKLKGLDARQLGSASVELGFVAAGRTESIMIPGAHVWDVAAGVLLVQEAGGRVTDFQGRDWNLSSHDMVATNGLIHQKLLKFLKV